MSDGQYNQGCSVRRIRQPYLSTETTRKGRLSRPILLGLMACLACTFPTACLGKNKAKTLPGKKTSITNVTFVAFDTETTGFNPTKDRIVEVGAVKFRNGRILEKKNWLVNPERDIPYWARRVHGITEDMVKDEPTFEEIYPEFLDFISGTVLMAHNAGFDVTFMAESIKRSKLKKPDNTVIDSLTLFRGWFPDCTSFTLEALATHLRINEGGFHRALADSMFIYWIMDEGLDERDDIRTLGALEKQAKSLRF